MDETIEGVGEKALISLIVRPLFEEGESSRILGDDCAVVDIPNGVQLLLSTDRVPADLIPFELGVFDYYLLGRHLAFLNISDIAACGGTPSSLLLNMGLPASLKVSDFKDICRGFRGGATQYGCRVVGGDISSSVELSLSATVAGFCPYGKALRRNGARPGDWVFASRPIGLTPASLVELSRADLRLSADARDALRAHMLETYPMIATGRWLAESGLCTSCMDNTDGLAQCLVELGEESHVAIVIEEENLCLPTIVREVAEASGLEPVALALGAGLDLSLVGTVARTLPGRAASEMGASGLFRIGRVEDGEGLFRESRGQRERVDVRGWNYFAVTTGRSVGVRCGFR